MEKREINVKEYKFEVIEYSDGSNTFRRTNLGFNIYELIGLTQITRSELLQELSGQKLPIDVIERVAIKSKEQ